VVEFASAVFLLIFIATISFYYATGAYLGMGYPYSTFLLSPVYHFSDFFDMQRITQGLSPYTDSTRSIYPPFANLFMYCTTALPPGWSLAAFMVIPWVGLLVLVRLVLRSMGWFLVFLVFLALYLTSYPILFNFDRGNSEIYIALLVGIFLSAYEQKGQTARGIAVVALALAISLKIVPAVFCFLYFKDRRWRDLISVFLAIILLNVLCLFAFKGGPWLNALLFLGMLGTAQDLSAEVLSFAGFSVSLYDGLRIAALWMNERLFAVWVFDNYLAIEILLLVVVCVRLWLGRFMIWESALCLASLACLLPTISNDYKLCLFISAGLLVLLDRGTTRRSYRFWVLALVACVCAPKNWIVVLPGEVRGDIGSGTVLTPLFLVLLILLIVGSRAEWRLLHCDRQTTGPMRWALGHIRIMRWVSAIAMLGGWTASVLLLCANPARDIRKLSLQEPVVYTCHAPEGPVLVSSLTQVPGRVFLYNLDCRLSFRPERQCPPGDLFATAPGICALRVEYRPRDEGGALVLVHERGPGLCFEHNLARVEVERPTNLVIRMKELGVLEVLVNGQNVFPRQVKVPADSRFRFDGLRVGGLFEGTQPFLGDIRFESLQADAMVVRKGDRKPMLVVAALGMVLALLGMGFLCWSARTTES